jgi:hypothetical protein
LRFIFNAFQYLQFKDWIKLYIIQKIKDPECNHNTNQTRSIEVWLGKEYKYMSFIFNKKRLNMSQRYNHGFSCVLDAIYDTLNKKDSVTNRQKLLKSVSFAMESSELDPTGLMDILINIMDNSSTRNFNIPLFTMLSILKINNLLTFSILNTIKIKTKNSNITAHLFDLILKILKRRLINTINYYQNMSTIFEDVNLLSTASIQIYMVPNNSLLKLYCSEFQLHKMHLFGRLISHGELEIAEHINTFFKSYYLHLDVIHFYFGHLVTLLKSLYRYQMKKNKNSIKYFNFKKKG